MRLLTLLLSAWLHRHEHRRHAHVAIEDPRKAAQ
jgi:hypothetical protein